MKILFRADSGRAIGGGHIMRCLSLATAAAEAGHDVTFVTTRGDGHIAERIAEAGIAVRYLDVPDDSPLDLPVEEWRPMAADTDAQLTSLYCRGADWIVLDHYGLGGTWVKAIRRDWPDLRVLVMDELDREALFADILLDPAQGDRGREFAPLSLLAGPRWALLRPEFARLRPDALAGPRERRLLVLPGMMDAAGLAPAALEALTGFADLDVDVIMGSQAQSRDVVADMVASNPRWQLHLDVTDMAERMARASYCVGAAGGTAWERCALGLASVSVAVSPNQQTGVDMMAAAGATIGLGRRAISEPERLATAIREMIARSGDLSAAAASLCDGRGAGRVVEAMSGQYRPVSTNDAQMLFDWRDQPHIRAASLDASPLVWKTHRAYVAGISAKRDDGLWLIYSEGGRPIGHVNAKTSDGEDWQWSFYIGETGALPGAGTRMLVGFLRRLFRDRRPARVTAQVLADNDPSRRLHLRLGFLQKNPGSDDVLELSLERCDFEARLGLKPERNHDD